jgi:UDP-3-O-[3-hydroxymyristoyl] N-acetylglucosamine deacetylase
MQRTIAEKISCTGIGLHSGQPVQLTLHPARAGTGVVFVRTDLAQPAEVPAVHSAVTSTRLATTLGCGDATVGTVEHLLAALCGLGIDNVRVEVDGPEIPVMDGSSASFVFLIRAAGIFDQGVPRRSLRVRRPVEVRDGDRLISPTRRSAASSFGTSRSTTRASSRRSVARAPSASSVRSKPSGATASPGAATWTTPW